MSETLRESLSTVIDGEADEFEIRRVLDEIERNENLRETWHRFHLIGSVMRGEPLPSPRLRAAIKTWLEGDEVRESTAPYEVSPPDEATANKPGGIPSRLIGAVAASVLVMTATAYLSFMQGAGPLDPSASMQAASPSQAPAIASAAESSVAATPSVNEGVAPERPTARRPSAAMEARLAEIRRSMSNLRTAGRGNPGIYNAAMDGQAANQPPPGFTARRSIMDQQRVHVYMLQHVQHSSVANRPPGMPFVKVITQKVEEPPR